MQVFPFLHILTNVCYLCSFWWHPFLQVWGNIWLWFWFAFLWWWVMLRFYSSSFPLWKNIVKMIILPQTIYRFNETPIKILMAFFTAQNFKICMEKQKTLNIQNNLKKNKARGIILPDFRLYYKPTEIKTVWYKHKRRHIDQ